MSFGNLILNTHAYNAYNKYLNKNEIYTSSYLVYSENQGKYCLKSLINRFFKKNISRSVHLYIYFFITFQKITTRVQHSTEF